LDHRITIDPRVTLFDLLRERLGLTGAKKSLYDLDAGDLTPSVVRMIVEIAKGSPRRGRFAVIEEPELLAAELCQWFRQFQ
jgi:hypothetical protein